MGRAAPATTSKYKVMLISAESINKNDCYRVTQISDDTVEFTTDHGVEYQINFMEDTSVWEKNAYQLVIINKNKKASPSDAMLRDTLIHIVENFFSENKNILLYICETGDGKQAARSKLFLRWFSNYSNSSAFYFKTTEITGEGVDNFAALILRKDNPDIDTIINDFDEMTTLLSDKPE